jgi:hypothetical protein
MIPAIEHSFVLTILYWLLMLPIAVFVLVRVTAFWAEEGPGTVARAVRAVLVMGAAVYLTFDFSAYVFARMMQCPELGISFPPKYHYWHWIREPLSLKWQILGFVPMIRYVPVVFGLLAGGIVQVILWKIPFRVGMIVFVSQIVLDVFAMAMLSLVFSFFVGVHAGAVGEARPGQGAGTYASGRPGAAAPASLQEMQWRIENLGAEQGPFVRRLWARCESVNRLLQPVYDFLEPVTRHLPLPVQDFLNGGGWLIVAVGLMVFAQRRTGFGRRRQNPTDR